MAMKIVLERENMTKQRHKVGVRRREGERRGEGCILAGGGGLHQASIISD